MRKEPDKSLRQIIIIGCIFGALGVVLGAFGAHALRDVLGDRGITTWKTAQNYHLIHSIMIVIVGMIYDKYPVQAIRWSAILLIIGILFFSGSLYLLSIFPEWSWLGPVTPIGGLCFILGWLATALGIFSSKIPSE